MLRRGMVIAVLVAAAAACSRSGLDDLLVADGQPPPEGGLTAPGSPDDAAGPDPVRDSGDEEGRAAWDATAIPEAGLDAMLPDATVQDAGVDASIDGEGGAEAGADGTVQADATEDVTEESPCRAGVLCAGQCCSALPPSTAQCIAGGRCLVTLAAGQLYPTGIAVSDTNVYFVHNDDLPGTIQSVVTVPIAGGTPVTLASSQPLTDTVRVDATGVYWGAVAGLVKMPFDGSPAATVTPMPVGRFVIDSVNVYFFGSDPEAGVSTADVEQARIPGGSANTLATGQFYASDIVADQTSVYWTTSIYSSVQKVPIGGGPPVVLAGGIGDRSVAVDSTGVYWTDIFGVTKVGLDGGAVTTLASAAYYPSGITIDSTSVYWTDWGGPCPSDGGVCPGNIMKVPLDGGVTTTLVSGQNYPMRIAVDSTSVYWTNTGYLPYAGGNAGGETVMKLTPK